MYKSRIKLSNEVERQQNKQAQQLSNLTIDVPDMKAYALPGTVELTDDPGPVISTCSFRVEKELREPDEVTLPTDITVG